MTIGPSTFHILILLFRLALKYNQKYNFCDLSANVINLLCCYGRINKVQMQYTDHSTDNIISAILLS